MIPTPTPLPPPEVAPITINASDYRIWQFADDAIQLWNYDPNIGTAIQIVVVVALVMAFVLLLMFLIQDIMSEE